MTIPRLLHQIWFQGEQNLPATYAARCSHLRAMNPNWAYRLWDDAGLREECRSVSLAAVAMYDSFQYMHQKIDFGRYVVLFNHGGMSVDMDVRALRPLDAVPGLNDRSFIVCKAPLGPIEIACFSLGSFTTLINNAMILAEPGSVYLAALIADILRARPARLGKMYTIQWSTGPFLFTKSVNRSMATAGSANVAILDAKFFEPCFSYDPHCVVDRAAILDHQHAVSWVGGGWLSLSTVYFSVKPYLTLVLLLVLMACVICRR